MAGYNSGFLPPYLTAEQTGGIDLGTAIDQGFKGYDQALEARYKPKTLAETLLAQQLQNRINAPKAEHAEEMTQADLELKQGDVGMLPYKQKLLLAQINKANRPAQQVLNNLEKAQLGYDRAVQSGDPVKIQQAKDYAMRIAQGSGGTTVYDPVTGNPLVQLGGMAGKSGGGTFVNPKTGEITSKPTGSTATNLQQRVVGAETIQPFLDKIVKTLPQFQNPSQLVSLYGQKVANALGGQNFPLPSQKAAGVAALKEASEGMLKAFGLNATSANRQAMEDILKPQFGESEEGYRDRVLNQAAEYAQNKATAAASLSGGIKLNANQKTNGNQPVIKYVRQNGQIVQAS